MKITLVAGARPNFMKIAPIIAALHAKRDQGHDINYRLVHTGQHYDANLSDAFFKDLGIPMPHINLDVKSGTQAEQTAAIMIGFEKDLCIHQTDLVMVVGDVTSTLACTIVAKKAGVDVAHVEAGIRSGDMDMPEEINRIVTDSLTDYFFTTSHHANKNLEALGNDLSKIFFVGNVMIDTLLKHKHRFTPPTIWSELDLQSKSYLVMTLHRPSNVDEETKLKALISVIVSNSRNYPIIFPVHPRTRKVLEKLDIQHSNLHYVDPLGYLEFNYLVEHALGVLTDSGGITEETTVMHVPCITLRNSTERPETVTIGTNEIVGTNPENIIPYLHKLVAGKWKKGGIPPMWDGRTAERIIEIVSNL